MLKFALLALLDAEPMSGYDLAKVAGGSVGFCWPAGHSQIYGELKKLTNDGFIAGEEIPQSGKPNKTVYTVTDNGRSELTAWAVTPIPMTGHRDPTALRVFALGHTDPATAHGVLTAHLAEHEERLALYRAVADLEYGGSLWPDEWGDHIGPSLALAGGIRFEEAWIGWMRDIIAVCEKSMSGLVP